jgi:guanylate kinase
MNESRMGRLIVVSAPSGTGKTSLCARLREKSSDIGVSISYTTRKPRGNERNGVQYHFVDDATFDRMVRENLFLEWAQVFDQRYGSSHAEVARFLQEGKDVLFDIDVQGGQQIKRSHPEALLLFLLPPSIDELVRRLTGRGTETGDQMKKRLRTSVWELVQGRGYDCQVINDRLEDAVEQVDSIRTGRADFSVRQDAFLEALIQQAEQRLLQ